MQNLIYSTYLAELLPFILCLILIKGIKRTELKVFFLYTGTIAFFLCLSLYFKFFVQNFSQQLIVNRIFLVVEFTFLCVFYSYCVINHFKKIFFTFSVILFLLYSFYDFYISKSGEFSFIPLVVECLFFILVIVVFFYEKIQYSIASPIYYASSFWISVAFLIYFSGNFFLFLFSKTMFKNPNFRAEYTAIYGTVTIIKNLFLCAAVIVNHAETKNGLNIPKPIDVDLGTFNPLPNQNNH